MFNRSFVVSFLENQNTFGFNKDVLVCFLDYVIFQSEKNIFLEFDSDQSAREFYDYCFDFKDGVFYFTQLKMLMKLSLVLCQNLIGLEKKLCCLYITRK